MPNFYKHSPPFKWSCLLNPSSPEYIPECTTSPPRYPLNGMFCIILHYFALFCLINFLFSLGLEKVRLEVVIDDLFRRNPAEITPLESDALYKYFHGYPVGCMCFKNNPFSFDQDFLDDHTSFLKVKESVIEDIPKPFNQGLFFNKQNYYILGQQFLTDYGGFVYLQKLDEEESDFFGLKERTFKVSIQPFEKWGFLFYIVGSNNCPGTYINEFREDSMLNKKLCSTQVKGRLKRNLPMFNCQLAEITCVGYNRETRMFENLKIFCDWLIRPIVVFSNHRIDHNDELLMKYINK